MKAAFAERDITPAVGMEMPGASRRTVHQGTTHDPCKVRAAVFEDGGSGAALVSVDAVIVPRSLVCAARKKIEARCGIVSAAVMIAATHTHSGGPLGFYELGQFDHAPSWIQHLAYAGSPCVDVGYARHVEAQIVSAVTEAWERRTEVLCGAAMGRAQKAAFTRRFRMRNGRTYTFPGQGNPDILSEAGPIDPGVGVLGVWDSRGRLAGCIVNFACHPNTKPGGTSADWVYYLESVLRAGVDADAVVLFMNGACGDVTAVDTMSRYTDQVGERWTRRIGARVGAAAMEALFDAVPGPIAPVATRVAQLRFARRQPSRMQLEEARQLVRADEPLQDGSAQWFFAKETLLLDSLCSREPDATVEIQTVQIGPTVFLACPGELFCELGLALKASSRFPMTFPISLANGFCGYLPTREALSRTGGGYETRLTGHSNLAATAGEDIVKALLDLSADMNPGRFPDLPVPPPFRQEWEFGNVPAEC